MYNAASAEDKHLATWGQQKQVAKANLQGSNSKFRMLEFQVFWKMLLYIHVTHGFYISGSEVAEERRRPGVQHLHGDPG